MKKSCTLIYKIHYTFAKSLQELVRKQTMPQTPMGKKDGDVLLIL
jgi:hypothetical protein